MKFPRMSQSTESSLLGRVVAIIGSAVLIVLGLMFSLVLFAVVIVMGIAVLGYFWWKTRALRKAMREQAQHLAPDGYVIDGEAIIVEEYSVRQERILPGEPDRK